METEVRGNDRVMTLPYDRAEATGIPHYRENTATSKYLLRAQEVPGLEYTRGS